MNNVPNKLIQSGILSLDEEAGHILVDGKTIKMTPVNMKVLAFLVKHSGQVVSRKAIFDAVWGNQVVSDDALTRAISDIRQELKRFLSTPVIETLSKRGYRWLLPLNGPTIKRKKSEVKMWILSALVASVFVWALISVLLRIDLSNAKTPVIILPADAGTVMNKPLQAEIEENIKHFVLNTQNYRFVSHRLISNIDSSNYELYSHRFKVRWVIESELKKTETEFELGLSVVDASTGMVERYRVLRWEDTTQLSKDAIYSALSSLMEDL